MVTVKGNIAEFIFFRPQAQQVFVAGDFNGWHETELAMIRGDDGYWRVAVLLPPGDFKFRYRCDGRWFTDFAAFGVEHGPFGWDSIVRVSRKVRRSASATRPFKSDRPTPVSAA